MTLKDKKNKREYQNKLKAQGGLKENDKNSKTKEKNKTPQAGSKPEKEEATVASNFEGVAENADKLIAEANKRYLEGETQQDEEDPKYAKRNITSNWTKYELPSSDEEDESVQSMTGADFHYVLASAQGADSHFRLKSEREWEMQTGNIGELSQEFFSLDLSELERSVSCLPLHQQICIDQEEFDKDMLDRLVKKAEAARGGSIATASEAEEVISKKIIDILNIGKKDTPKELLTEELKESVTAPSVGKVNDDQIEQGQARINHQETLRQEPPKNTSDQVAPLGQRANRRQRGTKSVSSKKESENQSGVDEDKDLKFMDNLDTDMKAKDDLEAEPATNIVPVTIVSEETKNLEDWLDDFLDD